MARSRKTDKPVHEHLFLKLRTWDARASATVNPGIHEPRRRYPEMSVHKFDTSVELTGLCTFPEERAGPEYHLTIYGRGTRPGEFTETLDDYHARDETGRRRYKRDRGGAAPVFDPPKGLGLLEKRRGRQEWTGWAWVAPHIVTDMVSLLSTNTAQYAAIHELKVGRTRWLFGITLQTSDPTLD